MNVRQNNGSAQGEAFIKFSQPRNSINHDDKTLYRLKTKFFNS